jgi:hypothetical protein
MVTTAQSIIRPISRFQRAIHVRYDLRDADAITQYIPTQSAARALSSILHNTQDNQTQRAHVLHAAYGSGKSHFAVALASLLEKPEDLADEVQSFVETLAEADVTCSERAYAYLSEDTRLFPVVLSGNEGGFAPSLLRALTRSLGASDIEIQLNTRFDAVLETIERWRETYPEFLVRLEEHLNAHNRTSMNDLVEALQSHNDNAYNLFVDLYAQMTAGAVFDPLIEQSPEVVYRDVASQLKHFGYHGIVVIWDEFGRYLEAHTAQAFGNEAAILQSFAETCNYSHDVQLHLLLFTHKELQGYASSLPQSYQQEWSRIEGRFQRHDLSTDPMIAYRLIASAIQYTDPAIVSRYLDEDTVSWYVDWVKNYRLFGTVSEEEIRHLIANTWPLHPLSVFALAHLSNRIAQNERTMFTFLTSDESNALRGLVDKKVIQNGDAPVVRVADLWDYFENAVRADIGGSGAHQHWSGVVNALDKVGATDDIGAEAVKAMGVITVCADSSAVRPETDLLAWATGARTDDDRQAVNHALNNLRRRKAVMNRQIDGYWTFISGSDINFEDLLQMTLDRINPSPLQLRKLLEQTIPAPYTLARRYNQAKAMTRYFKGVYRWANEIADTPWDLLIEQEQADGAVVYILAVDDVSWQEALDSIESYSQVVYVLPRENQPLVSIVEILRELFALQEINDDASLRQHDDRERIQREIDWLLEDAQGRLSNAVNRLIDPRQNQSVWVHVEDDVANGYHVSSPGQATRIVSKICEKVFAETPVLNSEGLNRRKPTAQQKRASQKVIDALFSHEPSETLGLEGRGPDVLALNSLLKSPEILRQDEHGQWLIAKPSDELLVAVWNKIEAFFEQSVNQKQSLAPLVDELSSPPYGLREGVLPLLLASVMQGRLMVTAMWHNRTPIGTIDGAVLQAVVDNADEYYIKIGHWSPQLEALWQVLVDRFDEFIQDVERNQQPLARLRAGMTRWLQGLPAFCRFTDQISEQAQQFRDVIRKVQTEPSKAIFEILPEVIHLDQLASADDVISVIDQLMHEISNAYYDLQRRLDIFVANEFGYTGLMQSGLITLKSWLGSVQLADDASINDFKFSSTLTQNVVNLLIELDENDAQFWNQMSMAVLGVSLRDWNDNSEERFQADLLRARDEVERDVHELIEEGKAVTFSIQLPDDKPREFRFRSSDLSVHGQRVLQNFKSTMDIAGRPLSVDERRKIALAFFVHVMGEDIDE